MPEAEEPTVSVRAQVLREAERLTTQERNGQYGEPGDVFAVIADLWSSYLHDGTDISRADVACMLALLKIARLRSDSWNRDSWTDLAGYAACGAEVAGR